MLSFVLLWLESNFFHPHFKFEHVSTLQLCQELPDEEALASSNFNQFMAEQADETRKLNEEVEKFKALLKTRGQL